MKKVMKLINSIIIAVVFTVNLSACGKSKGQAPQSKSDSKPDTITIGYQAGADDKMLVKEKGWFQEELAKQGIKLKYVSFNAGRDINNAVLSNSIDFGDLGDPPVTIAAANNIPYEVFWIGNVIGESEALVAKNKANINSIKDLKGKRVATTVSSTSHYSLLNALKSEGIDAKDIKLVDLNQADIVAAWQRGDIDAAYIWQPNLSKLIQADGKVITSSKEVAEKGAPTTNLLIVRKEFSKKYPQLVSLYVKQLIKAHDYFKSNPDDTAATLAKALQIDKSEAAKQAKEVEWLTPEEILSQRYLGTSSKKGDFAKSLKAIGDFLVDQKALTSKLDLSVYENKINSKYLEDALKK
ncbi:aliphatic sulfonate ABC transporter substrate-binding protein [Clostridium sp. DJ247]|uniref:taurine ABC transporter substrate-binding protein n=1 Tax=Clostridium sp. DJ247 TaxID=2726188 RepID=UPI001627CCF0|nr:aliphatic sulfonate ABC transporter substrate-binding protein [Clostridium sp. DJ247]MBC2582340.1 aliphatic sulfonate ABC transporter substrate-binding protein [Clostridium sp. DJ247]